ncbi:MAG: hypothetical protein ACLTW9_22505 [Enterocloster sp.]
MARLMELNKEKGRNRPDSWKKLYRALGRIGRGGLMPQKGACSMKLKRVFALSGGPSWRWQDCFILGHCAGFRRGRAEELSHGGYLLLVFIPIVMYAVGLMTRVLKPSAPPEGIDEDGDAGQDSLDKNSADSGDEL